MPLRTVIEVPEALADYLVKHQGEIGRKWLAALPGLAADFLDHWRLRVDGPAAHGMAALVLPVVRDDGVPAVLKLRTVNEDSADEATGLRTWDGDGSVLLLEEDPEAGALLLERLDAARPLSTVPDDGEAMTILAGLLARLTALPAPAGVRRLADVAVAMIDQVPQAVRTLADPADRELLRTCAAAVSELVGESGDRLLHWDLHYDNILASLPGSGREPWLAIDPQPLSGDPGFDLIPALDNRWEEVVATGDVRRAVLRRFDLLVETLGLDRDRAVGWTLGRVLQNSLWDVEDGEVGLQPVQVAIAQAVLS
ncbi:aminoglycoside phosphotransferase family protein [Rhizohabitans arisaemae]|uniref:aminoglycoside phosphotransferase family protein n=1 Tax=Rhizohabitans arisaemae TaxID=2720610 RepID=UPI003D160F2F